MEPEPLISQQSLTPFKSRSCFPKRVLVLFPALLLAPALAFWFLVPIARFDEPFSSVIVDRDGELLGASIAADEQWRFPPRTGVPGKFATAITLFEDKRFRAHPGVDPIALVRAVSSNLRSGRIVSGASTLTMQVVRLSRKAKPRGYVEKLIEMVMAARLECSLTKEEILALYAAHAPFGGNVVGLDAASWRYFGRSPHRLSWAEASMLAVLPNNPALIHPGRNRGRLVEKRNRLLDRLLEEGILDAMSCELSKKEPLPPRPHPLPLLAPHLMFRLQKERDGTGSAWTQTTLIKNLQARASETLASHQDRLTDNGVHNGAALILEVDSGKVLAYVGNFSNFEEEDTGSHVDIITAPRSTGSILKPLLYAAMLDAGEILPTQLVPDVPTRYGGFSPENFYRTYSGAVPAGTALARSLNIPASRMLVSYGVDRFSDLLKSLGMTTLIRPAREYGVSLILGGAEGTLWDITGIYAGMARSAGRQGRRSGKTGPPVFRPPTYVASTNPIPADSSARGPKAEPLGSGACYKALEAMLEVPRPGVDGFWRRFSSSGRIAWKTGTSYGFRDAWAVGVTPRYAIGVWVGNADGEGRPELTGFKAAAPILFDLFGLVETGDWFLDPRSDLVQVTVCARSGMRAGPNCEQTRTIATPGAGLRTRPCSYCTVVHCDADCNFQVHGGCESISSIRHVSWFVLPPAEAWYYRREHLDYKPLPPLREDCRDALSYPEATELSLIHPVSHSRIYIPVELEGERGKTVFKAAHRRPGSTVFWHVDDAYIGSTRDIHEIAWAPGGGEHTLTLVDEWGGQIRRSFTVIHKDN